MQVIRGFAADELWCHAHRSLMANIETAKVQPSRVGDTVELLHVAFELQDPKQRWIFSRNPPINPAFAIAETIWMLAGSNSAPILNYWFPQLPKFAGNGPTYPGSYGHRLRHHFGLDQIRRSYAALKSNPDSRQVVLQIWDPYTDLPNSDGEPRNSDIPCNLSSLLKIRNGRLEWTQVMRSSDLYRGIPYDWIQFTTVQEIIAGWLGLEAGTYNHWSDSLHVYSHDSEFKCTPQTTVERANDSFVVAVDEGELILGELFQRLVKLTEPNLSGTSIEALGLLPQAPNGFQNLLRVLAAESARRHRRWDVIEPLVSGCTNPQLVQAWDLWQTRQDSLRTH